MLCATAIGLQHLVSLSGHFFSRVYEFNGTRTRTVSQANCRYRVFPGTPETKEISKSSTVSGRASTGTLICRTSDSGFRVVSLPRLIRVTPQSGISLLKITVQASHLKTWV